VAVNERRACSFRCIISLCCWGIRFALFPAPLPPVPCASQPAHFFAAYEPDEHTGDVMYGYIADSCADDNYWCQKDPFHLDISKPLLDAAGLTEGWNGRKINWAYLDGPPAECGPSLLPLCPPDCISSSHVLSRLCHGEALGLCKYVVGHIKARKCCTH
jgi:hypothetical protein